MARKTVGQQQKEVREDKTRYDPLEVAYARFDDLEEQLRLCVEKYDPIYDEDEYCVVLVIARDSIFKNVRRHKYYAYLYLPSPAPNQVVFLYNKKTQKFKRLWCLPRPEIMALISQESYVAPRWQSTKRWCDSFYNRTFWEDIRKEHDITLLSETEYLKVHREELSKSRTDDIHAPLPESFDFSKIQIKDISHTCDPLPIKDVINSRREAKNSDGSICTQKS